MTTLGLEQRWRTPLGDRVVSFAPRPCGDGLIVRSGGQLFGLEREHGEVRWQSVIPDGTGLTACFAVIDDVAVTEVRDSRTKRSHFYGYEPDGRVRWHATLAAMVRGVVPAGTHELAAIVDVAPRELATIEIRDGAVASVALPFGATTVARVSATRWLLGSSAPGRDKPACYVLEGDGATSLESEHPVWGLAAASNRLLVVERDGTSRLGTLVARDAGTLAVVWRQPIVGEAFAVSGSSVIVTIGTPDAAAPAAFDLATGDKQWEVGALPKRAIWISAAPPFVLFVLSSEGGPRSILYTLDGDLRGSHEGYTSKELVVAGDHVFLTVDGDAVGLALPKAT